jgi:hypothetical protein
MVGADGGKGVARREAGLARAIFWAMSAVLLERAGSPVR